MSAKLHHIILLVACSLLAALPPTAEAQPQARVYTQPSHHDFLGPYGTSSAPAKPGYEGISLTLTCKEAAGILKMHGYRDIAELSCTGDIYRFEVSRVEGRFVIDIDPRTGNIVRRQQL
jgi:hypothetical protein